MKVHAHCCPLPTRTKPAAAFRTIACFTARLCDKVRRRNGAFTHLFLCRNKFCSGSSVSSQESVSPFDAARCIHSERVGRTRCCPRAVDATFSASCGCVVWRAPRSRSRTCLIGCHRRRLLRACASVFHQEACCKIRNRHNHARAGN